MTTPDALVSDKQVAAEVGGVSLMTIWRWTKNSDLGFPPIIKINGRNYRSRGDLEEFKRRLRVDHPSSSNFIPSGSADTKT